MEERKFKNRKCGSLICGSLIAQHYPYNTMHAIQSSSVEALKMKESVGNNVDMQI